MPAAYTPAQRAAIAQFVSYSSTKDSVAAKALKAANWDVNVALNAHYSKRPSSQSNSTTAVIASVFDTYRDNPANPDQIDTNGCMKYLSDLGASLEEPVALAVLHVVGAETIGELDRGKFVSGWENYTPSVSTLLSMQTAVNHMRVQLTTDPAFFKLIYKHTFLLSRAQGQKSAALDMAIEFWRLLFGDKGLPWKTKNVDWLDMWCKFLEEKWNKTVSRDMWNQLEVFARKTLDDETLSFWTEDSSWPTVIDEFVAYAKEKNNRMDIG